MGEARLDEYWSRTSSILALIANVHRDPKKTGPFKPSDFTPRPRKPRNTGSGNNDTIAAKADIGMLKDVFVKPNPKAQESST